MFNEGESDCMVTACSIISSTIPGSVRPSTLLKMAGDQQFNIPRVTPPTSKWVANNFTPAIQFVVNCYINLYQSKSGRRQLQPGILLLKNIRRSDFNFVTLQGHALYKRHRAFHWLAYIPFPDNQLSNFRE